MEKVRYVTYTESERETVRGGMSGITEVLMGDDADKKRSLLFCLDWFMDPYYKQDISNIRSELVDLLQRLIISPNEDDVIKDAIGLLMGYEWPPFPILERNRELIPEKFGQDIDELLAGEI